MNRQLHTTVHLLRHFGPGWLMFRAGYALRKRSGVLRRALPARSWVAQPLEGFLKDPRLADPQAYVRHRTEHPRPFLFDPVDRQTFRKFFSEWDADAAHPASEEGISPVSIADDLCDGVFRFFAHRSINLGRPPNWHLHPVTGDTYPYDRHWSEIGDFAAGDIKYVWEPSRFAWVYPLVRAYWRTGDERYPRLFWELLEDWRANNPPQQGVNWKCGQEIALRVMACCFGLYGFADSRETTSGRVAILAQVMGVSGQRIEANLSYAVSQQNNHGITEATGLWTIGLLFPEFADSSRWARIGRESLEDQCRALIDEDGSFSQHSVNYQRVMLHDCLWAIRLGELHGRALSGELRERVCRVGTFLWRMQDETTGRLPRYGANDGALVLPLTNRDPQDYRPVVQAAGWLRNRKRRFGRGPWDEELLWFFGPASLASDLDTEQHRDWQADQGGYCVLRSESGHVFTRAGSYGHRPSHADMLHMDVWWRGNNIALDPGTHTYNSPPPWDSPFARTSFHNTVTIDGRDQMDRAGRFLWFPWISGRQTPAITSAHGHFTSWEGGHDGYQRLLSSVEYRRGILRIGPEHWLIIDSLRSRTPHAYRLHWLLIDAPYILNEEQQHLRLRTPAGPYDVCIASSADATDISCVRAQQGGPRGWYAPYYGDKQPALSLEYAVDTQTATLCTLLGPSIAEVRCAGHEILASTEHWSCRVDLDDPSIQEAPLVRAVTLSGALTDQLHTGRQIVPSQSEPTAMHVLLIHQAFISPNEAGGTRHYELGKRFVAAGNQFTIVTSSLTYLSGTKVAQPGEGPEAYDGVQVRRTWTYAALHRSYVWRVVSFLSFMVSSVWAAVRVRDVDVVMGTSPPIFQLLSAWIVSVIKWKPFVLEVRDLWPEFAIDIGVLKNPVLIWFARRLESFLYNRATHLIVNSPAYRDYLIDKGIPPGKISFVANGVDPSMFDNVIGGDDLREEFDLQNKFVVTYAGAIGQANDLDTVLEAADILRDDPIAHFFLVGDGKECDRLQERAVEMRLPNVTFTGPRPKHEMPRLLAMSDACLATLRDIPMFRTTYPNKVFDYMAAARPTILAIDGVIRDVVEAANGGVAVQPGDAAALASAVRELSRDRQRCVEMGRSAHAYVQQHFDRNEQATEFRQTIERVALRRAA